MPEDRSRSQRVSLTKAQRATAAGAELLSLCQSVTADGSLDDAEVAALKQWLEDHRETDLPAHRFLYETVERILADGKVTREERRELYKAVEKVLPPEIRTGAVASRRASEHEEARRNMRLARYDFMVAGVWYEGRPEVIRRFARDEDCVFLVRDPRNRYSRNATEIRLENGGMIGYLPEESAIEAAPLLDRGGKHIAWIKKILTGGRVPIPVVIAEIYGPEADIKEYEVPAVPSTAAIQESPIRSIPEEKRVSRAGCLTLVGMITFSLVLLLDF